MTSRQTHSEKERLKAMSKIEDIVDEFKIKNKNKRTRQSGEKQFNPNEC